MSTSGGNRPPFGERVRGVERRRRERRVTTISRLGLAPRERRSGGDRRSGADRRWPFIAPGSPLHEIEP